MSENTKVIKKVIKLKKLHKNKLKNTGKEVSVCMTINFTIFDSTKLKNIVILKQR